MNIDYAALTDLYQITMAQGYYDHGMGSTEACFHMYFRNYPFKGGYAIACGMDQLAELVETYGFTDEDVEYLASLPAPAVGSCSTRTSWSIWPTSACRWTSMRCRKARRCSRTSRSCGLKAPSWNASS